MADNFKTALQYVSEDEAGFWDDPIGGPTKYGIRERTYAHWLREKGRVPRPIQKITRSEATAIYKAEYWSKIGCGLLRAGLDYAVFDMAVHSGPVAAAEALQRAVNALHERELEVDGYIGPVTRDLARDCNIEALIHKFCDERLAYVKTRPAWRKFEDGMRNRIAKCRQRAVAMAQLAGDGQTPVTRLPMPKDVPSRSQGDDSRSQAKLIVLAIAAAAAAAIAGAEALGVGDWFGGK